VNELDEKLQSVLVSRAAVILKCDPAQIEWEDDIDEYGFDSLAASQLCVDLNAMFSVELHPAIFLEATSLAALSDYLKKRHYANLENVLM